MLILLHERASTRDVERVVARVREAGLRPHVRKHGHHVVILATGERPEAVEAALRREPSVEAVRRIARPYILASRDCQPSSTRVDLGGGTAIGGGGVVVIAGPGCVEDEAMLLEAGRAVAAAGAHVLKAGVHEASASPYGFQGPGRSALRSLALVGAATGLPVLSDVRAAG
ncbi:MAG TPA: 3-deoxy-7-phosphoheptulonate synthase, partial [Candidatus Dormibacteraeota bacterium]|nr:3-deoxy-7-phosphoheptulonate synthase [Candidatus Dormibacteraeota bacterium]